MALAFIELHMQVLQQLYKVHADGSNGFVIVRCVLYLLLTVCALNFVRDHMFNCAYIHEMLQIAPCIIKCCVCIVTYGYETTLTLVANAPPPPLPLVHVWVACLLHPIVVHTESHR